MWRDNLCGRNTRSGERIPGLKLKCICCVFERLQGAGTTPPPRSCAHKHKNFGIETLCVCSGKLFPGEVLYGSTMDESSWQAASEQIAEYRGEVSPFYNRSPLSLSLSPFSFSFFLSFALPLILSHSRVRPPALISRRRGLDDEAAQNLLNELADRLGTALGQRRIYVSFCDSVWVRERLH